MSDPTTETYEFLTRVCNSINEHCFSGELPKVILTVKGKGRVFGYYKERAFVSHDGEVVDEIAVNPAYFATHGFKELLQTLAHEMCHQWQYSYGTPSARSYHNKEFAEKMKSIGLIPSDTGEEGGKETGQKMADYMADSGLLIDLYNTLEEQGEFIPWYERLSTKATDQAVTPDAPENVVIGSASSEETGEKPNNTTRARYTHQCKDDSKPSVIYGKPNLPIQCGECGEAWLQGA